MNHPTLAAIVAVAMLVLPGCRTTRPSGMEPTAVLEAATSHDAATAVRRDFQIVFKLEGATRDSSAVGLVSNRQLALRSDVTVGTPLQRGQELGDIVVDDLVERALSAGARTSRIDEGRLAQLRTLAGPLVAPVSGIFEIEAGRPVLQAPGIDVVVELTAVQDLRYRSLAFAGRAIVETVVGEREVACHGVWLTASDTAAVDNGGPASRLHCRLPPHVETAAGLRARVVLESQILRDSVVVPNRLVGYDSKVDGYYLNVETTGGSVRLPVVVGVTDGVVRVVTSDVPRGARLLPIEDQE